MPRAHSVLRRATLFASGGRVFTRIKNIDKYSKYRVSSSGCLEGGHKWTPRARVYRAMAMSMLFTVVTRISKLKKISSVYGSWDNGIWRANIHVGLGLLGKFFLRWNNSMKQRGSCVQLSVYYSRMGLLFICRCVLSVKGWYFSATENNVDWTIEKVIKVTVIEIIDINIFGFDES